MDTGTRRFFLRLAVGLLTFLVGVAAVWALAGLNPFQGSTETTPSYRYKKSCNAYRSWNVPAPSEKAEVTGQILYLKGPHGMRMKMEMDKLNREMSELGRDFNELPPPPPHAPHAPMAR
jgi:hypothetical protein